MDGSLSLDGRVVVVSGAGGGGIGTTVTRMAAEAGATVVAVSRSQDNLDTHVAPLADKGLNVVTVAADASTDEGIATVLDAARDAEGTLYGLVNVAGGAAPSTWMPATRVSRDDWRELFTANLETMFFMSQAVAAEIRTQGNPGSIVSVSSISGMNTAPYHVAYGTAKAAIVAATRTMAAELAAEGIRVNAVAPGVTETAASATYVDADPERDQRAIAMGRRGTSEEQAGAILFLLSDLSSYITGQTILVDGGLNLRWTHLGADNTSLFLKDESFREAIRRI
ncbi:SDR family NAD(P)-dependent oxidoreductase [Mycolicibacterium porcinum]